MISLHDLIYDPLKKPRAVGSPAPTPWKISRLHQEADERVAYRGLSLDEVRGFVVVGCPTKRQLETLTERFTGLRAIFLPTVDAITRVRLSRDAPQWSGALTHRDCWLQHVDKEIPLAHRYAQLCQAVLATRIEIAHCVLIRVNTDCDLDSEELDYIHDLLDGHGSRYAWRGVDLRANDRRPWSKRFADFLFSQREFLQALFIYLTLYRKSEQPDIARQIAACWSALECHRQAVAWLARAELPAEVHEDLVNKLRAAGNAQVQSYRQLRAQNQNHLQQAFPELAVALADTTPSDVEVAWLRNVPWILGSNKPGERVTRQDYPVLVQVTGKHITAINPPRPPRTIRRAISSVSNSLFAHACIGSVAAVDVLLNVMRNPVVSAAPNWVQQVYVVQEDLPTLARVAEVCDLRRLLAPPRVVFEWGPGADDRMAQRFRTRRELCLPMIRLALSDALSAQLEAVEQERLDDTYRSIDVIHERHDQAALRSTYKKLEAGEPLRVWAMSSNRTTVLQYVVRDLLDAMRRLGHDCKLLIENGPGEYAGNMIAESVASAKPDVLIMIDHLRAQVPKVLPPTLPCMTLILDELPNLVVPDTVAELGPYDLAFPWSHALAESYRALGYPHAESLPFAANAERYRVEEELGLHNVVAFATHLDVLHDYDYARGFLAAMERRYRHRPEVPRGMSQVRPLVDRLIAKRPWQISRSRREDLYYLALLLTRVVDRMKIAEAVIDSRLPLVLYGRGWDNYERFRSYVGGVVSPGESLRRMYHTHKVVLHVNQNCNLHPRVLETMCAGGFVLARSDGAHDDRRSPDWIGNHFDLERELCLFEDMPDMVAKIRRALTDEAWRQSYIAAGRARVLRDHTYLQRAQKMLAELRHRLGEGLKQVESGAA